MGEEEGREGRGNGPGGAGRLRKIWKGAGRGGPAESKENVRQRLGEGLQH